MNKSFCIVIQKKKERKKERKKHGLVNAGSADGILSRELTS
jgi:hypothetical protein